ncbi:MAG: hypothetical protein ACRCT1_20390 [Microcoleaceae cyanobacterium]
MKPPKVIRTKSVSPDGKTVTETVNVIWDDDNLSSIGQSVSVSSGEGYSYSYASSSTTSGCSYSSSQKID